MAYVLRDVVHAARTLRRARASTATAVLTLGLGIGAVTSIFSVIDAVLIRSVPFPRPGQLHVIWEMGAADPSRVGEVSYYTFREWRRLTRSFSDIASFGSVNWSFDLQGRGDRRSVPYAAVSWSFFNTLGATPARGRVFLAEDDRPNAARVVVIVTRSGRPCRAVSLTSLANG